MLNKATGHTYGYQPFERRWLFAYLLLRNGIYWIWSCDDANLFSRLCRLPPWTHQWCQSLTPFRRCLPYIHHDAHIICHHHASLMSHVLYGKYKKYAILRLGQHLHLLNKMFCRTGGYVDLWCRRKRTVFRFWRHSFTRTSNGCIRLTFWMMIRSLTVSFKIQARRWVGLELR